MDSEDELALPPDTLALLQQFRQEEAERVEEFNRLSKEADEKFSKKKDIELFKEDWQLSQFWYNLATAQTLARALLEGADENTIIAIISAPSVYAAMTGIPEAFPENVTLEKNVFLFEIDTRFRVLAGDNFFVYDFNKPFELPEKMIGKCHRILADPPFLNEECQTKTALSVRKLLVPDKETALTKNGDKQYRMISCTGERMSKLVKKIYPGVHVTDFYPEHQRGLSNEFRCYSNFEGIWKFID